MDKAAVRALLSRSAYAQLAEAAAGDFPLISRRLLGLTYDKTQDLGWRAIVALGVICGVVAPRDSSAVRALAQRLLWMMRDESGNNPGSAPEILGEMVRACPDDLCDIAPIIASFSDEEMLRPGVVWALYRIAQVRPDLVSCPKGFFAELLGDRNPCVRAYALLACEALGIKGLEDQVAGLAGDESQVPVFMGDVLTDTPVGSIALRMQGKDGKC